MINRISLFSLAFICLFFSSCESYRVLLVTRLDINNLSEELYQNIVEGFKPSLDMDRVLNGSSEFCQGLALDNPVFFCKKRKQIIILSFYKYFDNSGKFTQEKFYAFKKSRYEEESLIYHYKLVNEFQKRLNIKTMSESLVNKNEMGEIIKEFVD